MRNFKLLPPALYYLFLVFVCKGNKIICCTQIILLKSLCFYLLLTFINKYIYILNTILQIKVLPHLIIYRAIVRGSPGGCPPWCLPGVLVVVLGGSLVAGVLVVAGGALVVSWCPRWWFSVAPWWLVSSWWLVVAALPGVLVVSWCSSVAGVLVVAPWWLVVAPWQPRPHIHSRKRKRVHARLSSAAALSLVKRSCKESLLDAIALIINYLGVPFGMAFTGWLFS